MKTSREDILAASLNLFAERGFDAVSTSMIAASVGITKGALYRHFSNKQEIFESIIKRMFELDEQRANEDHVPAKEIKDDPASYSQTSLVDFCEFVNNQFIFWTEDSFASAFRRMITIEQYKNAEMRKLYQDVIASGPVNYTTNLLSEMIKNNQLNDKAKNFGAYNLAIQLFAPLKLVIEMADGGCARDQLSNSLRALTKEFENNWIKK